MDDKLEDARKQKPETHHGVAVLRDWGDELLVDPPDDKAIPMPIVRLGAHAPKFGVT